MNQFKNASMQIYYALALSDNEEISLSEDDLLLIAEDYAEMKCFTNSSAEE